MVAWGRTPDAYLYSGLGIRSSRRRDAPQSVHLECILTVRDNPQYSIHLNVMNLFAGSGILQAAFGQSI